MVNGMVNGMNISSKVNQLVPGDGGCCKRDGKVNEYIAGVLKDRYGESAILDMERLKTGDLSILRRLYALNESIKFYAPFNPLNKLGKQWKSLQSDNNNLVKFALGTTRVPNQILTFNKETGETKLLSQAVAFQELTMDKAGNVKETRRGYS